MRKFLRGRPTTRHRMDAKQDGQYPFTKTEFRNERKHVETLKGRRLTYREILSGCQVKF